MKTEIIVIKEVIIKLSAEEATWLRAALQNPLHPNESISEAGMRSDLFDCLYEFKE